MLKLVMLPTFIMLLLGILSLFSVVLLPLSTPDWLIFQLILWGIIWLLVGVIFLSIEAHSGRDIFRKIRR